MTTTRRASTLCPRDNGRTVEGEDTEGTPFHGTLTGGNFAGNSLTLWIGRNPVEVRLDAWVHVTGAVVKPSVPVNDFPSVLGSPPALGCSAPQEIDPVETASNSSLRSFGDGLVTDEVGAMHRTSSFHEPSVCGGSGLVTERIRTP